MGNWANIDKRVVLRDQFYRRNFLMSVKYFSININILAIPIITKSLHIYHAIFVMLVINLMVPNFNLQEQHPAAAAANEMV